MAALVEQASGVAIRSLGAFFHSLPLSFSQDTVARLTSLGLIGCTHTFLKGLQLFSRMTKAMGSKSRRFTTDKTVGEAAAALQAVVPENHFGVSQCETDRTPPSALLRHFVAPIDRITAQISFAHFDTLTPAVIQPPEAAENLSSLGKDPLHFPRP